MKYPNKNQQHKSFFIKSCEMMISYDTIIFSFTIFYKCKIM